NAMAITDRCRLALTKLEIPTAEGVVLSLSASFGVACSHENMDIDNLFRDADRALYLAKERGRNQVVRA
ncbi:MAG: hypothetical protein CVV10_06730, partial [Gammaproteobacteria bacterium HGW-Gammaproteobacteria-14]